MNYEQHPLKCLQRLIVSDRLGVAVDIALCSPVRVTQDCTLYLPMLDMTTDTPSAPVQSPQKCALASWARGVGAEIYLTGRASHAYVPKLLTQAEWLAFLGRAILDLPVDVRWIGHGLISGVHALRWTKNAKGYLQMPTKWEP